MIRAKGLVFALSAFIIVFFRVWNPADAQENRAQARAADTAAQTAPQDAPQSKAAQLTALQGCVTFRMVVEQAYRESAYGHPVAEVTLPFGAVGRALFAGAGLRPVEEGEADVVVTIRSEGVAKATTGTEKFYVWARVSGTISIAARNQSVIEERFDGSSPGLMAGTPLYDWQRKPQSAPFMKAFVSDDRSFLETILRLTAGIWGPKALVGAIGDFRQIGMDGNGGMQSLTCVLGETGGPAAVEPLIHLLKDPSAQVEAAKQLGARKEPSAVDALIAVLSAPGWEAPCAAAEALGQIGDDRAIPPLIENLKDAEAGRACVAEVLAKFKDERVADALMGGLKGNRDVRIGSARALRILADPRTAPPLIEALSDPDDWIKMEVAESLGAIPDPRSIDPMLVALDTVRDGYMRSKVASALGLILRKFPDPRAVEPIISIFEKTGNRQLIDAIAPIPDDRAFDFLMNCLRSTDSGVQEAAANALRGSKDPRAVDELLNALQDPAIRENALTALGGFDQPRVTQALLAALLDPEHNVGWSAAASLGRIKNPDTVPRLIALLRNKAARASAAKALREITGKDFDYDYKRWSQWWKRQGKKG